MITRIGLLCCTLAVVAMPAAADQRPGVVELFTSQGCSSCPPADALLGELARRDGVIALGFHISYWDHLGWKDPLSSPEATARQRAYAHRLSDGVVYTPQLVVDGTSEMVGSDRAKVLAALGAAQAGATVPVHITEDRRSVAIGRGEGKGEVLLVRFLQHRSTLVAAGENAGRAADDFNGVEQLTILGQWDGAATSFHIDPPGAGAGLAVLIQAPDGHIIGAVKLLGPG